MGRNFRGFLRGTGRNFRGLRHQAEPLLGGCIILVGSFGSGTWDLDAALVVRSNPM